MSTPHYPFLSAVLFAALLVTPASAQVQKKPPVAKPPIKGQKIGMVYIPPPPGLALFNKALDATNAGNFAEAERLYREVVKSDSQAAAAWANLGLIVGRQGRLKEAIGHIEKATVISPETAAFWAQLASFQLRASQWKAAETSSRKALAREPANLLAVSNLADSLFQQRRFTDAVPVFQKLRQLEGDPPSDHTEISLVLSLTGSGKYTEAIAEAQKRTKRLPNDANAFLLLGDTARRAKNIPVAEKAYARASALDPKNGGGLAGLVATAALQGDRSAALKWIDQRILREPKNAVLYFQKGYLLYTDTREKPARRYSSAEEAFRKAATLDPKSSLYRTYTGVVLMMQGPFPHLPQDQDPPTGARGFDEADGYLRGALALSPRDTMARLALASISEQRKHLEEALAHYQAILSYDAANADAHRGIAGIYYATGKKQLAYNEMETIARLRPQDVQALGELASWYVADKRIGDAKEVYGRIIERDARDAAAHIALGSLYEDEKNPVKAVAEYQTAFNIQPTNRDAAILLGNALARQNRTEDAINIYRAFLHAVPDNNDVRWQLALALRDSKRVDEALAEMHNLTLQERDPNRTLYLLSVPQLLLTQKRYDEAIRTLLQQLGEHPKEDEIRYLLAEAYKQAGLLDKAEDTLSEIANRPPDAQGRTIAQPARPRILLAELYEGASKWDEAARQYEDVLRLDPMQTTSLYALNRVREKQNKPGAAVDFLADLAMADPKEPSVPAIGGLHQLLVYDHKLDRWREFTRNLLAKYPENRNARYIRARSLTEENKVADAETEAVKLYEQMIKSDPKDQEAYRNLASELEALGRKDEAVIAYKALLKLNPTDSDALSALQRLNAK